MELCTVSFRIPRSPHYILPPRCRIPVRTNCDHRPTSFLFMLYISTETRISSFLAPAFCTVYFLYHIYRFAQLSSFPKMPSFRQQPYQVLGGIWHWSGKASLFVGYPPEIASSGQSQLHFVPFQIYLWFQSYMTSSHFPNIC